MSFSAKGKLIYLAHPRTASIATERALAKIFPTRARKTPDHHAQLKDIIYRTGREKIITTIRDPLDMIVSWYMVNPSYHESWTFTQFVKNYEHDMMDRGGKLFYFLKDAHFFMRFENLQQDFNAIMIKCGFRRFKIPVANVTKGKKPFMEYHTKESINAMWERWPDAMGMYHDRP